jgi:hypothetical protein
MNTMVRDSMYELNETFKEIVEISIDNFYHSKITAAIQLVTEMFEAILNNQTIRKVFPEDVQQLTLFSNEIITALDNVDYVTTADILEFQVLPIFNHWTDELLIK